MVFIEWSSEVILSKFFPGLSTASYGFMGYINT